MHDTCQAVITWLQTLTVASVLLNFFLAGLVGTIWFEYRRVAFGVVDKVIKANLAAGLTEIFWLADTREDMSRSSVVAKQLAHNSIFGKDDPATLKRLYDELDNIDAIIESFLRPEDFDNVKQLEPASITDISVGIQ